MLSCRPPYRRGFSLIELVVTVTLLGITSVIITTLIIQQQRIYVGSADLIETRANLRQIADILPAELRAISPSRGDIYAMDASSIELRAPTGSAIICDIDSSRSRITIPPLLTAERNGTSAWLHQPRDGDSLLVYDHGATVSVLDDAWRAHMLLSVPAPGVCTLFTASAGEAARGYTLVLASPLAAGVRPGAVIRLFRRATYELYDAADGLGYLGFSDCLATRSPACSVRQPVSGPYLPRAGATPGLVLSYFDSSGVVTTDARRVARIDVLARSESRSAISIAGYPSGRYTDSISFTIAARN